MNASFFTSNRGQTLKDTNGQPIVIAGHNLMQRSNDAAFAFSQEANFWYLTGIEAPDWTVVISDQDSWLIAPDVDEVHQLFDGGLSFDEARRISGIETVLNAEEGKVRLNQLSQKNDVVWTLGTNPQAGHYDFTLNPAPSALLRKLKKQFSSVQDCRLLLASRRAIKQPEEIAAIRGAIDVTIEAFENAASRLNNFSYEYEVEAEFSHYFRSHGATGHAYDPIVAGGNNACTLHYVKNQDSLQSGELLLLDIGARKDGYAADITRTYSIGTPTERQVNVHHAVESAQKEIISLLKPGLDIVEYAKKVDQIMRGKLEDLGLLKTPGDYRKYFPHSVSHGLGVDVHDLLGRPDEFKPGMVLTVEPGIYIPEEGIGVRIEDDILITKTGHENLSAALPTSL